MAKSRLGGTVRIIVVGGSAGALEVLVQLLPRLRPDLPVPLLIVLHRRAESDSALAEVLGSRCPLPVKEAEDKEPLRPGQVYLAPGDYHLLVEADGTLALDASEKIHFTRPAIDVTFETAAEAYGPAVFGLLLSGANDDGTAGLQRIAQQGGGVLIQDPETAVIQHMPLHALKSIKGTVLLPEEMADYVNSLFDRES